MGALSLLCTLLPVKRNKIVFVNYCGQGWGGSPRYIAEEIFRQGLDYDLVWLTEDASLSFPSGIRTARLFSRRGRLELSTARVIITNTKRKLPFIKRSCQFYIQTWHGDFALKLIEGEVEDKLDAGYVAGSKAESKETDICLSGSRQFSDIVRKSFWYDGEIFESGLPSNDLYFKDSANLENSVRTFFKIPDGTRIALYAPTFRDGDRDFEFLDFDLFHHLLEQKTASPWVIVARLHPNDIARSSKIQFNACVLDGSHYRDTQELAKASDLLVTDYSSIMYDFALQRKPVILFTPDLEAYLQRRGLRDIYWELPFPQVRAKEALEDAIDTVFGSDYSTRQTSFMKERICSYDDGHASERIVDRIRQVVEGSFHHGRTIH